MFIATEGNPKTRAPEERNVVIDRSPRQHSAPPELANFMEPPGLAETSFSDSLLVRLDNSDNGI
jgi:hypothetical protein